jgi:cobalt-zinc-cadmium resistance protein CzcA
MNIGLQVSEEMVKKHPELQYLQQQIKIGELKYNEKSRLLNFLSDTPIRV